MTTTRYGKLYFCIMVPKAVSKSGEIHLMADEIVIGPDGSLSVIQKRGSLTQINFALASGKWIGVYAASVIDGGAVAVEHWG